MKLSFFIFLLLFSFNGFGQIDCACCTDNHKLFDFWIGDWNVYDTTGTLIGENTIIKLEDDCILNEHWRGKGGTTGRSYNYFNNSDSTWNQLWIDNSGSDLILKGKGIDGVKMVLSSDLIPGKKIDFYRNRITWTLNDDGTVTQLWDIMNKEGTKLNELFKGIYKKKKP